MSSKVERAMECDGGLTTGSRFVNPRFMNLRVEQGGADITAVRSFPTGCWVEQQSGYAYAMEILKIFSDTGQNVDLDDVPAGYLLTARLTHQQIATIAEWDAMVYSDDRIFWERSQIFRNAFTAGGSFYEQQEEIQCTDLTDGAGHGYLVASDSITLGISGSTGGNTNGVYVKILFRYKRIPMTDFAALAQNQQN